MKLRWKRGALALGLGWALVGANAADLGANLIVNGDAEAGLAGWGLYDAETPLFDAVRYDDSYWGLASMPGAPDRGENLFVGGQAKAAAVGVQTLDLASFAGAITAGQVSYAMSGWLGGWSNQTDDAVLTALFLDAAGNVLDYAQLGPVTPADRGNTTSLLYRELGGTLSAGTRQVQFLLSMERSGSGSDNDGYADNLSFAISAVPEPHTLGLMLAGLGLVAGAASVSRRHR